MLSDKINPTAQRQKNISPTGCYFRLSHPSALQEVATCRTVLRSDGGANTPVLFTQEGKQNTFCNILLKNKNIALITVFNIFFNINNVVK